MATKPKKKTPAKKSTKKFVTPVFRASFPHLFMAHAMDDKSEAKFGVSAIWTPAKFTAREKELWKAILAEMDRQCIEAFGKKRADLPGNYKKGIRNGNEREDMEGYGEGTRFANLTSKNRPGVIDKDNNEISKEEGNTDEIYPGCYLRATVGIYTYDVSGGKGVALGLRNIQKVKDGERLDNRTDADEDFADEELDSAYDDDDEDDSGDEDEDDFD